MKQCHESSDDHKCTLTINEWSPLILLLFSCSYDECLQQQGLNPHELRRSTWLKAGRCSPTWKHFEQGTGCLAELEIAVCARLVRCNRVKNVDTSALIKWIKMTNKLSLWFEKVRALASTRTRLRLICITLLHEHDVCFILPSVLTRAGQTFDQLGHSGF